jgi:hypothetical protein
MKTVREAHYFGIALLNFYFDFEDYSNPIKSYLEEFNEFGIVDETTQMIERYIQRNELSYRNNLFYDFSAQEDHFYSIGRDITLLLNFAAFNQDYVDLVFNLSNEYDVYEKKSKISSK